MSLAETLDVVVELVPEDAEARWVEIACGPGLIARAMAPRVGSVLGLDLTPAMIEKARAEAAEAGVENVSFEVGDATALDLPDDSLDGAITRFSLHHIPAPVRVLEEMRRVVKPGGYVVVADHVTDDDGASGGLARTDRAPPRPLALGLPDPVAPRGAGRAGRPRARPRPRWSPSKSTSRSGCNRGSGGPAHAELIERLLGRSAADGRELRRHAARATTAPSAYRNSLHRWRVP